MPSAWIEVSGRRERFLANPAGWYRLTLPEGTYLVSVFALGYRTSTVPLQVGTDTTLTITLAIEPVALQAIEVQVDRLARRLAPLPWSVSTITREELLASLEATPVDLLKARRLQLIPCDARSGMSGECVRFRGGRRMPLVCIDDQPAFGGLDALRAYATGSLHRIEVHERGLMIRAYTSWYIGKMMEGKVAFQSTLRMDQMQC